MKKLKLTAHYNKISLKIRLDQAKKIVGHLSGTEYFDKIERDV